MLYPCLVHNLTSFDIKAANDGYGGKTAIRSWGGPVNKLAAAQMLRYEFNSPEPSRVQCSAPVTPELVKRGRQ